MGGSRRWQAREVVHRRRERGGARGVGVPTLWWGGWMRDTPTNPPTPKEDNINRDGSKGCAVILENTRLGLRTWEMIIG